MATRAAIWAARVAPVLAVLSAVVMVLLPDTYHDI
jgi:hypothetical protein